MSNRRLLNGTAFNGAPSAFVLAGLLASASAAGAFAPSAFHQAAFIAPATAEHVSFSGWAEMPGFFSASLNSAGVVIPSRTAGGQFAASTNTSGYAYVLSSVVGSFSGDATATGEWIPDAKLGEFAVALTSTAEWDAHRVLPAAYLTTGSATADAIPVDIDRGARFAVPLTARASFESNYRANGDDYDQLEATFSAQSGMDFALDDTKVNLYTWFQASMSATASVTARIVYAGARFSATGSATYTQDNERVVSGASFAASQGQATGDWFANHETWCGFDGSYGSTAAFRAVSTQQAAFVSEGVALSADLAPSTQHRAHWVAVGGFDAEDINFAAHHFSSWIDVASGVAEEVPSLQDHAGVWDAVAGTLEGKIAPAEHHYAEIDAVAGMPEGKIAPAEHHYAEIDAVATSIATPMPVIFLSNWHASASVEVSLFLAFANVDEKSGRVMRVPSQAREMFVPYQNRTMVVPS
jgi:hypothetical protein